MKKTPILIVDDDEWLAEQYKRSLNSQGYDVTIASHAIAAIQLVDDIHPSAIILDVLLTGSTAFALLHELQSYSDTGDIPVIICTNLAGDLSIEDLKPYGVRRILDKTKMLPSDLLVALRSVLL
ncbi:MAG: response regulator [Candidatus Saccharibacteria bacterium]